jgi:hypothetical protein
MGVSGWPLAVSPVAVQYFLGYLLLAIRCLTLSSKSERYG